MTPQEFEDLYDSNRTLLAERGPELVELCSRMLGSHARADELEKARSEAAALVVKAQEALRQQAEDRGKLEAEVLRLRSEVSWLRGKCDGLSDAISVMAREV